MRRHQAGTALALALGAMAATHSAASAQPLEAEIGMAITAVKRVHPEVKVQLDPGTGLPKRITGLKAQSDPAAALAVTRDASGRPSEADVRRAVERFFAASEISAAFPQRSSQARRVIETIRPDPDIPGQSVAHVTQQVAGIPVFGSAAKVVVNPSLAVTDLTASFSRTEVRSTEAKISESVAIQAARETLGDMLRSRKGDPGLDRLAAGIDDLPAKAERMFYDPALMRARGARPGSIRLTWLVRMEAFHVFVDAATAEVVFLYRDRPTLLVRRVFDLDGDTRFPGSELVDEARGVATTAMPEDAVKAMENSSAVHAYFLEVLGRNSFDDSDGPGPKGGAALVSYVRFGAMKNALWCKASSFECPKTDVMVYGPGFAGALDVVAHEVTHGVISHAADLVYTDEPGAVNEALADIFGTLVEFHATDGNGNWMIGETLPGVRQGEPMRSMANPNLSDISGRSLFDRSQGFSALNRGQPDHFGDYVDRDDPICETTYDYFNGCVHFNSGILNKLAHLVAAGGEHRGIGISGIGVDKLGRVAYRALTMRLNGSSGLVEAGEAFADSCWDLAAAGVAGFAAQDCSEVEKARQAVGLVAGS